MSSKAIVVLLIIVLVVLGGYWYMNRDKMPSYISSQTNGSEVKTSDTLQTSSNDSSDAALAKDVTTIGVQMNALSTDSANADQGLNDKPVSQAE
jgi:Tfp pilus assembly protein PilO